MTHVGQKRTLGQVGGFCFLLLAQQRLGLLALRDIFDSPFVIDDASRFVALDAGIFADPDDSAVGSVDLRLKVGDDVVGVQ